jgi:integrase
MGEPAKSRSDRIRGFQEALRHQLDAAEVEAWSTMSADARWLCEDKGWLLDPASPSFDYLCQTLMRARIQAYRNELRRLEGSFSPDPAHDPLFGLQAPKRANVAATLGDLRARFEEEREGRWSASTRKNYSIIFRVLEEVCGIDTPLEAIDRDFCRNVRKQLIGLPAHYQKSPSTRGRSIADAIEIAKNEKMPTISAATINNHLNKLGAILRYGRDQGWITGNPMADLEIPDPVDPSDKRDPFTVEQLNLIFARPPWSEGPEAEPDRPSRFWAPLISLFSGARLTEVCGQRVDEMIVEDGVHLFHFRHRPEERHIKGGKSRKVPVHPQLIALGFWDFVEQARASGRDHLFSDVKRDKLGKWGDHTTKWFSRQVKALNLRGQKLSFHSFRHSFEDALRRADLHDTPIGNAITGRWTAGVSKNYGSRYPVTKLREALSQVNYPGLNITANLHTQK